MIFNNTILSFRRFPEVKMSKSFTQFKIFYGAVRGAVSDVKRHFHDNVIVPFLLLLLLTITSNISAQIDYDFGGYIYNLPIVQFNRSEYVDLFGAKKISLMNLTRLRFKPQIYLWDRGRIGIEYEITALGYNSLGRAALNFGGRTNRQLADLSWNLIAEDNFTAVHFIDRLYFRQGFDFGNIIIGRQRISWGTGRIWNPTDLFNPLNPADYYKYEKDGADAVSAKFNFGNFTDLNLVYNPVNNFETANLAGRFRTNFNEFDVSAVGGYVDKKIIFGGDFAGNLFDAGIRGEAVYSSDKNNPDKNFVRFILGADYQFTSKFYAMIEYQFNGEGKYDRNDYEIDRLFKGEIINLSRNYIYLMLVYQLSPLWNLSIGENSNLNDGSGFVLAMFEHSLSDEIYLNIGGQYSYGAELSEYRYYSPSIFGQLEFYF